MQPEKAQAALYLTATASMRPVISDGCNGTFYTVVFAAKLASMRPVISDGCNDGSTCRRSSLERSFNEARHF